VGRCDRRSAARGGVSILAGRGTGAVVAAVAGHHAVRGGIRQDVMTAVASPTAVLNIRVLPTSQLGSLLNFAGWRNFAGFAASSHFSAFAV
jgi:hypothetical protein